MPFGIVKKIVSVQVLADDLHTVLFGKGKRMTAIVNRLDSVTEKYHQNLHACLD